MDDERVLVQCGHCGARYRIAKRLRGRKAKCRRCRYVFRLTPKDSLDDTVLDWLEEGDEVKKSEPDSTTSRT